MLIAEPFSGVVIVLKNMAGNRKSTQKSRNYLQELLKLLNDKCAFKSKTIKWQKGAEMERLTVNCVDKVYDTFDPVDVVDNEYSKANYNRILTKLGEYEDLEEQGRLVKLPYKDVYFIVDANNPKYALVMRRSVRELAIYEIESIDKENCKYFSTEEKAEAKLKELRCYNGSL